MFDPLTFLSRLAALVPPPKVHQLTYHGLLAPGDPWRDEVVPANRFTTRAKMDVRSQENFLHIVAMWRRLS